MKFKSDIEVQAGLRDGGNDIGTAGQLLSSTGAVTNWIDQGGVVAGEADKAKSVILRVKNSTLSAMTKGQVICENVSISPPNGNLIEVALADNNTAGRMPALGILNEDLDAAGGNNDEGDAIMFGKVSGIDTSSFSVGDEVFVSDVPGGLTITKPTGVKYIQKVGVVIRDDNTNGTIEVFGAGRVNDVPTPLYIDHANQRLGIGAINPTQKLDIRDGELVFTSSVVNQNPSGRIRFNEYSDSQVSGAYIDYDGSSNAFSMFTNDTLNDYEFLRANRNSHLLLQPNGNRVGIGTTSPSEKLVVRDGTSNTDVKILAYNSALGTEATLKFSTIASETNYEKAAIIARNAAGSYGRNDMHFALDSAPDIGNVQFSDTKMTILNGGNVGIGITDPSHTLEVKGTVQIKDEGSGYLYFHNTNNFIYGDQYNSLRAYAGDNFRIVTNSGEKMRILSNGNVGIGETDPESKLHIKTPTASSSDMLLLENYGWAANMTTGIAFKNGSNYQGQTAKIYTIMNGSGNQGGEIRFATLAYSGINPNPNTTLIDRMTIDDLGGVGIGNTDPQAKLHVQDYTTGESHQAMFKGGSVDVGDYSYISLNGGYASDYGKEVRLAAVSESAFGNKTGFAVLTSPDSSGASGHERLRVTADGDVGIGTTNPQARLEIAGSSSNGKFLLIDNVGSGGTFLNVEDGVGSQLLQIKRETGNTISFNSFNDFNFIGNVGIGATDPSEKLEVAGKVYIESQGVAWNTTTPGTTRGALHFDPVGNAANNTGNAITFGASDTGSGSTAQAGIYTRTDSTYGTRMYLATTDSYSAGSKTRMTIYSNGNVGIGALEPAEKLEVAGNIKVSGDQYFNGSVIEGDGKEIIRYSDTWLRINEDQDFTNGIYCGSGILRTDGIFQVGPSGSKFVVNSIGNVGIGTNQPASDLEIARTTSGAVSVLNLSGGTLGQYGGGGTINIKGGGQYMNFGLNVKNSSAGLESSIGYSGSTRTWTFDGNQLGENGGGYTSYNFKSEGSSQMVIYNNNVGIGVTNPNVRLEIGGGSTLARVIPAINNQGYIGDSQHRWQAIYATNGTIQTSDIREKTGIKPTELGLDFINDLNPVSYKWTEGERLDASKDERNHQGLIAQEVAETLEKHGVDKNKFGGLDIQKTDEYDDFHAMSYEQLIAPMIKSIQELKAEIEELKKQINK